MNRKALLGLSCAHLTSDLNTGSITAILPLMQSLFALSYSAAALAVLVSNVTSSVIQPLFGLLADRHRMLWLMPPALLVAGAGTAAYAFVGSYGAFIALVAVSGVGSAAFHPVGASSAYFAAGARRASGMSVFSVGGNVGFALGPLLTATATGLYGLRGMAVFVVPGLFASLALRALGRHLETGTRRGRDAPAKVPWLLLGLLVAVVVLRSAIQYAVMTFFPLYLMHLHLLTPALSGGVLFFFLIMGAAGTLAGGPLSDRYGRRPLLVASFLACIPLLYLLARLHGALQLLDLGALGFAVVATFSTTVVLSQELLPGRQAIASSLTIGLAIGLGGVITLGLGQLADRYGVLWVLSLLWVFAVAALCGSLLLPGPRRVPRLGAG